MNTLSSFSKFERILIVMAVEYYILNKQPDPVAGGVPHKEHMQHLFAKFFKDNTNE